jgi:hypothetical protein
MKTIGVYTKDFSLYHDILKSLKIRKLSYVLLSSPKNIPYRIGVVLTSKAESHKIKAQKIVSVDTFDTVNHAVDMALKKLIGKKLYKQVFIGIDPGDRPGVAIVGNDMLLQKIQMESPEEVVQIIKRLMKLYPSKETYIRIGHGSILTRNRIINSLIPLKIPIEIVDETSTTNTQQIKRFSRDKEAAAAIALLSGGRVQKTLPLFPTRGAIKNVQTHSRQLTDGKYTISEKVAEQVLKGEISLVEAIEKEKSKPKSL